MSATNNGNQRIYFKHTHTATGKEFNKPFYKILKPGVYDGGGLNIVTGDDISISVFTALFQTSEGQVVRISTDTPATLSITETTPYIIGNYVWVDALNNYIDFTAKALGSIVVNDIVFGKGEYVATVLTSFSYSNKTWGALTQDGDSIAETVLINGDNGGKADMIGITNVVDSSMSTGAGSIKLKTGNPGNSAGFIKFYNGTSIIYVPYFTNINP